MWDNLGEKEDRIKKSNMLVRGVPYGENRENKRDDIQRDNSWELKIGERHKYSNWRSICPKEKVITYRKTVVKLLKTNDKENHKSILRKMTDYLQRSKT